jgi:hypothetical protein
MLIFLCDIHIFMGACLNLLPFCICIVGGAQLNCTCPRQETRESKERRSRKASSTYSVEAALDGGAAAAAGVRAGAGHPAVSQRHTAKTKGRRKGSWTLAQATVHKLCQNTAEREVTKDKTSNPYVASSRT